MSRSSEKTEREPVPGRRESRPYPDVWDFGRSKSGGPGPEREASEGRLQTGRSQLARCRSELLTAVRGVISKLFHLTCVALSSAL